MRRGHLDDAELEIGGSCASAIASSSLAQGCSSCGDASLAHGDEVLTMTPSAESQLPAISLRLGGYR